MRPKIKKHYAGFVPAYVSHPMNLCRYYHCTKDRYSDSHCMEHAELYAKEVQAQEGKVLVWPITTTDPA